MKKINTKPFDMQKKPVKEKWFLTPIKWILSLPTTYYRKLKVNKVNMDGLKPPYLLLCTHHAFIDFKVQTRAIFPHKATYVVAIDGFIGKEWLLRNVGGIGKRKFTPQDKMLYRNIKYSLDQLKLITTIYAESAYSISGTNSALPDSLHKAIKLFNHPVVVLNMHGNFLTQPNYMMPKLRKIPLTADMTQIITKIDLETITLDEIKSRVNKAFEYDEWQYQFDNKIAIKDKNRAHGLNRILYQCPNCLTEHQMEAKGATITCLKCHTAHELSIYGKLNNLNGKTIYDHVPDWYEFQRQFTKEQLLNDTYYFEDEVMIESLRNAKGFIPLGKGNLIHTKEGIKLTGNDIEGPLNLFRESSSLYTIHIEFGYKRSDKKRAAAVVLSTDNDTYYIYPNNKKDVVTKIRFAVEEAYKLSKQSKNIT
ncbi:hypothetical protein [Acholeplasma granularum]|uniref:hypothetical protein n=1 Tax=Acholeplasma granularum TaxID=264635 RepID=UPI0004723AAC|nr:hypothetical protein [Acholeplasma granularum]